MSVLFLRDSYFFFCCWNVNNNLADVYFFVLGQALLDSAESFKRLADIKYSMEDSVRQNFLEPLHNLQAKDLKEVNVSGIWFLCCAFQQIRGSYHVNW